MNVGRRRYRLRGTARRCTRHGPWAGDEAELWAEVPARAAGGRVLPAAAGPGRQGGGRLERAGRRGAGRSRGGAGPARTLSARPSGSRRTWNACTGGRPGGGPGTLVRVSHAGTARGIGGLLEDYAFCAEGLLALYAATGRTALVPRWPRQLIAAACRGSWSDGTPAWTPPGSPAQVLNAQGGRAGAGPLRQRHAQRRGRVRRRAAGLRGAVRVQRSTVPWPATSWPCCRRWPPGRRGWRAGCSRPRRPHSPARWRPPSSAGHPERDGAAPGLLLSPSPGLVVAAGATTAPDSRCRCCGTAAPPRTARRGVPVPRHGL